MKHLSRTRGYAIITSFRSLHSRAGRGVPLARGSTIDVKDLRKINLEACKLIDAARLAEEQKPIELKRSGFL